VLFFLTKTACNAGAFCRWLQQMSLDCTGSESQSQHPATSPHQLLHTYKTASVSRGQSSAPYPGSVFCRHEAIARTVNVDSLTGFHNRPLFGSHPATFSTGTSRQPQSSLSPSVTLSSAVGSRQSLGALSRNVLQPAFPSSVQHSSLLHGTVQLSQPPPNFATPASVFRSQLQSVANQSSFVRSEAPPVITQQSPLSRDHPSSAINRLREKIGRGWLPPEPPYPPPPDDTPETHNVLPPESRAIVFSSHEQSRISAPVGDVVKVYPESESFYAEPPQVDSTTEVTTTTDDANELDDPEMVTYATKRPVEREDGEISDDEPDSVGADLPPDSSGISSSNWSQSRPQPYGGVRGGGVVMYRPRFSYRGRFPRGRGFFRGGHGGFAPWRGQWYDQRPSRSWSAADDEHVVDSSGVLSPPTTETARKHSGSVRSTVHSPISSTDSEREESIRHSRSERHSPTSDRRSRHRSKSKHDDHPVADSSTRTSLVASPEFEPSSDSDKEQASHSAATKKKVCCFGSVAVSDTSH